MNQWYTEGELLYKPELDIATPEFNKSYFPSPPSLKADIIEMNIETKDTKIFMHNNNKKVNIKSIN